MPLALASAFCDVNVHKALAWLRLRLLHGGCFQGVALALASALHGVFEKPLWGSFLQHHRDATSCAFLVGALILWDRFLSTFNVPLHPARVLLLNMQSRGFRGSCVRRICKFSLEGKI